MAEGKSNVVKDPVSSKEDKGSTNNVNKIKNCIRINGEKLFKDMPCSQNVIINIINYKALITHVRTRIPQ